MERMQLTLRMINEHDTIELHYEKVKEVSSL